MAATRDLSASSPRPVATKASPTARLALLACALGWLFDGYETYALILVGAIAIRDLIAPDQLAELPLYFGGLMAVTLVGWATGGVLCGVFADYLGRRRTLMLSIVLYAVFTGLSAVAQSYWVLLASRFLTGLGLGGEYAPGTTLVGELWTPARRGRAAGALSSAFGVGCLLASGLWLLVRDLGPGAWRVMFLLGILPALLLLWLRRSVEDPAIWRETDRRRRAARQAARVGRSLSEDERRLTRFTITDLFASPELRRRTLLLLVMSLATIVVNWGVSTWLPQYANHVATRAGYAAGPWGAHAGLMYGAGGIAGFLVLGMLADLWGRKPTIGLFFAGSVVAAIAPFLVDNDLVLFMAAATINGFFTSGQYAWMAIYLPEVYPTAVRATGTAVVFNSGRYLAACGPLVAGWLVESLGGIARAAALISLLYLLGLVATPFAAPETKGQPLPP
jgi:MFS family permease